MPNKDDAINQSQEIKKQETNVFTYDKEKYGEVPKEVLDRAIKFGELKTKHTYKDQVKNEFGKDLEKNYIPLDKHQESLQELENTKKSLGEKDNLIKEYQWKDEFIKHNGNSKQFDNFKKLIDPTKDIKVNVMNLKKEMPNLFNLELNTNNIFNAPAKYQSKPKTDAEKAESIYQSNVRKP